MRRYTLILGFGALVLGLAIDFTPAGAAEKPEGSDAAVNDNVQDFVFLAEARPLLVRLHVTTDGKSLQANWDDFMPYLFKYLDVNGDGVLSKEEAERAPSTDQLRGGALRALGGRRGGGGTPAPTMNDLDADKDGKVTLAELSAYYRKHGFSPFQLQFPSGANPLAMGAAFLGGGPPEPSAAAVSEALFNLLDTGKDGKLTKEKLLAAPAVLLKLDENEDEMIIPRELLPNAAPADPLAGLLAMAGPGAQGPPTRNKHLIPITSRGQLPDGLVRTMQERYGPAADKPEEKKLTRKDLGLDEATFASLDANGDGVLDAEELAGFVKRAPDLELAVQLRNKRAAEQPITQQEKAPLAGKLQMKDGQGLLDLGKTRVELLASGGAGDPLARFGGLARDQYLAQFRQLDSENKGFIEEKQVQNNRLLKSLFKAIDRDGDGKVTEKEVVAYLDFLQELQKRAAAACVTLQFSDQSRGLFDLLDTDHDGRLSVREMRGAIKLLQQLDTDGKGFLTKADVPRIYRLTLRPGFASAGGGPNQFFAALYGGTGMQSAPTRPARGPLWFQKMDRNRDGDVSRKEWLYSEELFRKIDTDGDGLISVEEAEAFDKLTRQNQKQ
jgi:Ca2+-binding EF-hand superfamily protein